MEHNKAPGPDGFPPEFYQVFWSVIKEDLMTLFQEFHAGTLDLHSLNFGTTILLPKSSEAKQIQQYHPICLLNVSFKILTKVSFKILTKVALQTAFLPGRNKMEGRLFSMRRFMSCIKRNGMAYDNVRWDFLHQTLRMNGFLPKWCSWGLRLMIRLGRTSRPKKEYVKSKGLIPHLVQDGLSILQYADDTVIFLEHYIEQAKNLKLLLCAFKQLSGLKINFHKSEIFCFGQAKQQEEDYSHLFGCSLGSFPFRYLGIPMHYRKLSNKDWALVEDRFEKSLSRWKGKLLSVGGRLVLINSFSRWEFQKKYFKRWTTIDQGFIGKMINIERNIGWQGRRYSANLNIRGV
ncbi:hypothetical protein U9M48_028246 [Paspalum notatum var. saurae]|uniref:Reverse transcriptase domain-containing protein n=1 Tax=Paspalum notatum var. saurae TaxID=547442 RepID=A0AAQ3U0R6_PASNO